MNTDRGTFSGYLSETTSQLAPTGRVPSQRDYHARRSLRLPGAAIVELLEVKLSMKEKNASIYLACHAFRVSYCTTRVLYDAERNGRSVTSFSLYMLPTYTFTWVVCVM